MTKEEIFNRTLSRIGDRDYEVGSEQAKQCERHFKSAVHEVLVAARWGFATKIETLRGPDHIKFGTLFTLPDDCLRLLKVSAPHYQIIQDKQILIKNAINQLDIEYISSDGFDCSCTSWPSVDPLFINAVVALLAHKICMMVTGDKEMEIQLLQEYHSKILPQAMTINKFQDASNDQHPLQEILSRSLTRKR